MARMALAHKACRMEEAQGLLARICRTYPEAAITLLRQNGAAGRRVCPPARRALRRRRAEDRLPQVRAIVLLQEGADRTGRGVLGAWVAAQVGGMYPAVALQVAAEMRQEGVQGGRA